MSLKHFLHLLLFRQQLRQECKNPFVFAGALFGRGQLKLQQVTSDVKVQMIVRWRRLLLHRDHIRSMHHYCFAILCRRLFQMAFDLWVLENVRLQPWALDLL